MDDLDRKILTLLAKNARMPVKEIAEQDFLCLAAGLIFCVISITVG